MNENQYLITQIQEYLNNLGSDHERTSFWCSDSEKPLFDLYHEWIGTEPTNPIEAEKLIMFSAGKMMELALVEKLQKAGLAKDIKEQERVEMERQGIKITGYIDCILDNGIPCEVKSFYGIYQLRELKAGKPKSSYLKQLAIYMDFLGQDKGRLIYMERGTGEMFEFILLRNGTKFKCMSVEFDIEDTYSKWANLYNNHILPKIEPEREYKYKIPVGQIDWSTVNKSDISKARNNRKVIGDWQVKYSKYLNLYLEREGTVRGYTNEELEKIKEATKGYSTR